MLYPKFQIFDVPSRKFCSVDRPRTNTPFQALVTLILNLDETITRE